MQIIHSILQIKSNGAAITDENGSATGVELEIMLGTAVRMEFDLRGDSGPDGGELTVYPAESINTAAYYFALDTNNRNSNAPALLKYNGIELAKDDAGHNILVVELENSATEKIIAAVAGQESCNFRAEIGGVDTDGMTVFAWQFDISIRSRVFLGEADEVIANDPAYYTAVQTLAMLNERSDGIRNELNDQLAENMSNPVEFQFSADGESNWHTTQNENDLFFRQRISGLEAMWSDPVAMLPGPPGMNGESGTSAGVAVGTIFAYPASVPPEGAYLLNGQTIANCSTIYPKFWEWVQSAGVRIIDSATYEAELASTGVCGGFAVDTEAGSIRLPSIMQGTLWGADSGSTGQSLAAGLPNITGSFTPRDSAAYPAGAGTGGAFKVGTKTSSAILGSQSGYDGYAMTFDASRSNAIYGNSDTVQPPAVRVSWCIQVFTSATDFSEQESTQLASEMQLKAQTDLANVNSAGKSFIVDQLTYGVPETREINVVYQAEKAGYAYVSAKASSNANTTDKIASMVVQASPYADFSQNNIYARRNDLNANASATHIQFIPEGWYYRFVTYNSTDETLRFFPVNSDN